MLVLPKNTSIPETGSYTYTFNINLLYNLHTNSDTGHILKLALFFATNYRHCCKTSCKWRCHVVSYGCETWTYSKAIDHKINAFEMWCYRRMLRISWTSHTTNIGVLRKIGVKKTTTLNNLKNRKLSYAGHIARNTSGHFDTLLTYQDEHGSTNGLALNVTIR